MTIRNRDFFDFIAEVFQVPRGIILRQYKNPGFFALIARILEKLNDEEKLAVLSRYNSDRTRVYKNIGREYGLSSENLCLKYVEAVDKIRSYLLITKAENLKNDGKK